MSITFPTATKNARADLIVDSIDLGTTNATGRLYLKDSGNNVLSVHNFANPAFASASGGACIANSIANGVGLLAGSAVTFDVKDRDNNVIFSGTIGTVGSGADLESSSSSVTVAIGEVVVISGMTYIEAS